MESKFKQITDVWLPAITLTLALWVPSLTIYCRCAVFFTFTPFHFLILTGKVAIPFMLGLAVLLYILRKWHHYDKIILTMLILIVQVWVQGEVFGCFYHKASVTDVWRNMDDCWLGSVLMVISLSLVWLMIRFKRFFMENRTRILLCLVCWLIFSTTSAIRSYQMPPYDDMNYLIDEEFKYDFASQDNIIVVIVDCMGKRLFNEMEQQFPDAMEDFTDFTRFDNMLSDVPKTAMAIPGMFTGIVYPGSVNDFGKRPHALWLNECFKSPTCIFPKLQQLGYRCECYPLIAHIISLSTGAFVNIKFHKYYVDEDYMVWLSWRQRMLPMIFKAFFGITFKDKPLLVPGMDLHTKNPDNLLNDPLFRQRIMNDFHIGNTEKCFKYYHLFGAHEPLATDENLNEIGPEATRVQQLRGSLKAVQALLSQLKAHGLYDRSMIVVTGDHDENYEPEIATFIKLPGQHQEAMTVIKETTHIKDIGQSILAACGIEKEKDVLFSHKIREMNKMQQDEK